MAEKWTCQGSVRGECGVIHRTREAADRCCLQDHNGCHRTGGYSDRRPVRLDETDGTCPQCGSPVVWDPDEHVWVCQAHPWTEGHWCSSDRPPDDE